MLACMLTMQIPSHMTEVENREDDGREAVRICNVYVCRCSCEVSFFMSRLNWPIG